MKKLLYLSYLYIIFIYPLLLHLKNPPTINYYIYIYGIVAFVFVLLKSGPKRMAGKYDALSLLFFTCYFILSLLIYFSFSSLSEFSWIIRDFYYSVLPPIMYLIVRLSKISISKTIILSITLYSIVIYDMISIICFFMPYSAIANFFEQSIGDGISEYAVRGYLSVILTGFLNTVGLCISVLGSISIGNIKRIIFSILFIFCGLLSGQRTPIGCWLIIILVVLFLSEKKIKRNFCLMLLALIFIFVNANIEIDGISIKERNINRNIVRIENALNGDSGRKNQQQILTTNNFFFILFGDGVGRHSPENPQAEIAMPDAMMYRIFNEMGIIGTLLFLIFFLINLRQSIRRKDSFMIAFIVCCFFSNFFNRVLFYTPISFIPYVIIAVCNWEKYDYNEKYTDNRLLRK